MSSENDEDESVIKYSAHYGGISSEAKFWEDFEEFGEKQLLNSKITKVKIYLGKFKGKDAIFGIGFTYQNLFNGNEQFVEHKGSDEFIDVKELVIKEGEYLTDFHIRFKNDASYISQLGYTTNKQNSILVGIEEGEDKTITSNGGENIIVGSFGGVSKKLDSTGVLFVNKKEYFKRILNQIDGIIILRNFVKKSQNFKEGWDKKQNELPSEYKFIWRTVNLPETPLLQILKFLFKKD